MPLRSYLASASALIGVVVACGTVPHDTAAIDVVAPAIDRTNTLTISRADLSTKANPKGAGTIVYATQGRPAVWVVVEGAAYALNSPAKIVTPSIPWAREAPEERWKSTNLNPLSATEVLEIVGRDK
jgi:hypothetical protein